jgi:DNA uptake protein ComE-like DNA-binding protein
MLGIGRPDLPRWYDDGGLIDVNQVPASVLAALPGVDAGPAHRLVQDRQLNGPFRTIDDVVSRGLLPAAVVHRLAARLICLGEPVGSAVGR